MTSAPETAAPPGICLPLLPIDTPRYCVDGANVGIPQQVLLNIQRRVHLAEQGRCKERDYRWSLVRALPQYDESARLVRLVGVTTDIHDQVIAKQALRESEEHYCMLFEGNLRPWPSVGGWTRSPIRKIYVPA